MLALALLAVVRSRPPISVADPQVGRYGFIELSPVMTSCLASASESPRTAAGLTARLSTDPPTF